MVERFLIDLLEGSRLTRTLFLISLATACSKAPAPESTIQFVYKSSIQSADTTPPELSDDDCFLVHVTGDHSSLRAVAPRSDQASACPAGPQGLGLLNGLLKKGETVSLSVPSGPARRFDIVAIPKALLPLGNRECRGTVSGKAALEKGVFGNPDFFVDSEKVSSKNFKLIATGTADLSPGVNVVTLERVQSSAPYECVANEVVETKIVSTSVISPDGSYGATQTIDIQINFSEGVVVSGSPRLKLETGTVDHSASFLSITADKKGLVFRYPIVAGDATSALEYFSQTSLELNGGTIKTETSGTNVLLTLPPPGSAVSLSGGRFVSIDTVNPNLTITTPSSLFANATTSANLVFTGTCSESGEVVSVIPAVVASPVTCTGAHAWAMTVNVSTQSDGPVNLQFSHHDLAGNIDVKNLTIIKDTVAPGSPTLSINTGASYTSSLSVNLGLSAAGATELFLSNVAGCTIGFWESFSSSKTWTLPTPNSLNNVYVKFRDTAQNETSCITQSITHDNAAPAWSGASVTHAASDAATNATPQISYTATASDGGGIQKYQYALGTEATPPFLNDVKDWTDIIGNPYTVSGLQLAGGYKYFVSMRAVDYVGNTSPVVTSSGWVVSAAPAALPSTNGTINSMLRIGNTLYVGGQFTSVGTYTGFGTPIDSGTANIPGAAFPKVNGPIYAAISDGASGWFIGGSFTMIGSSAQSNIAHILSDGNLDVSFNQPANGPVYALALSGGTLFAGGSFTIIGGASRTQLAALDPVTGVASGQNVVPSLNGTVRAIVTDGSQLFIGGDFTSVAGTTQYHVANLNNSTFALSAKSAWSSPGSFNNTVKALALNGVSLYIGGNFTNALGDSAHNYLVAVDTTNGNIVSAWAAATVNAVNALALDGTRLYIGGNFSQINGTARSNIGAVDVTTGALQSWNPGVDGMIDSMTLYGSTVYVGGMFGNAGGQSRKGLAALDAGSNGALSWNPNLDARITALAVSSGQVYVGSVQPLLTNSSPRLNLAAFNLLTGTVMGSWNPGALGGSGVYALATDGVNIYVGGAFSTLGGTARSNIGAVDLTGSPTSWNPGSNSNVYALALDGTYIYAGGNFSTMGSQTRSHIAKLDLNSNTATSWNAGSINADVLAIALNGSSVYIGGYFTTVTASTRNYVAALDVSSAGLQSFQPSFSGFVKTLLVDNGVLYAGGAFTQINGITRSRVGAIDIGSQSVTAWDPSASGNYVSSLARRNSDILMGGQFTNMQGQSRIALAAVNLSGSIAAWNPGLGANPSSSVNSLLVGGDNVYIGGQIDRIGGKDSSSLGVVRGNAGLAP